MTVDMYGIDTLPDISISVNMYSMRISPTAPCCTPLQQAPLSESDAEDLATMLKALADPVRLRLLSLIAAAERGEACACDLTEPAGRSQATVSHHLSQLTQVGILEREQRGKWAWFRLDQDRLTGICAAVCATSTD
jgi:ArsR family transcriptional regulator, arsenate/arsenite/antimonite-responsive transcriptional repressor